MPLIDIENIDYVRLEDSLHCLEHHKGDEVECVICAPIVEAIPKIDYEARLKADMVAMLEELKYDLYHALCHEIHGKEEEDCPCTNQTTSCLATFRVCDANEAIYKAIQQKIDLLQKQTTDNCDNCFNGTTKGGCAVKELKKNKDCKYYMPRKNQCFEG